ncbi:hypothetical protein Tco_0465756 [Tanacetum coccineum]
MMEIVPVEKIKAEALQVKYHIIDWEIHTEDLSKITKALEETDDEDVEEEYAEVEYDMEQIEQQTTPTKDPQDASREKVKTYNKRRRSTDSSRDSTDGGLFSTAEEIQGKEQISTDEEIAKKLNEEEMAKAAAREEQKRIDFEKALEIQKQLDQRKETNDIDWNTIVEQVQERQSGSMIRYQTLKKKPVRMCTL